MGCRIVFNIVLKGREIASCADFAIALRKAAKLRNIHGKYNVWLRAHTILVGA
jgi:hypothetical protein